MNTRHQITWMKQNGYSEHTGWGTSPDRRTFEKMVPFKDAFLSFYVWLWLKDEDGKRKTKSRWHVEVEYDFPVGKPDPEFGQSYMGGMLVVDDNLVILDGKDIRKLDAHLMRSVEEWKNKDVKFLS